MVIGITVMMPPKIRVKLLKKRGGVKRGLCCGRRRVLANKKGSQVNIWDTCKVCHLFVLILGKTLLTLLSFFQTLKSSLVNKTGISSTRTTLKYFKLFTASLGFLFSDKKLNYNRPENYFLVLINHVYDCLSTDNCSLFCNVKLQIGMLLVRSLYLDP